MTPTKLALLAAAGMLVTSVSVLSLTTPGKTAAPASASAPQAGAESATASSASASPAQFSAGTTLVVDGRLGHAKLVRAPRGETFVMLELRAADVARAKAKAEVNLALVIDRSGSMKGTRLRNAISAATAAVDRLNEGDVVTVVTFDTQVQVVVPPTRITAGAREQVAASIRKITLGGDTCVSCGIEQGITLLEQTTGKISRMIVLSDGDANHGVRDLAGFSAIAERAMTRGVNITTIGVDIEYNEKILQAIAQGSNGHHYFVENDASLPRIFEAEAEGLTGTLASNVEATVALAPGVELEQVFDRSARKSGDRIVVPLGTFSRSEVKTVLLKVRAKTSAVGPVAIADVDIAFRDLVADADGRCSGKLGVEVVDAAADASDLDPLVRGRLSRSETAATLKEANDLFAQGLVDEARGKLDAQQKSLQAAADAAGRAAPTATSLARDFEGQLGAVADASKGFTPKAPAGGGVAVKPQATPTGKTTVKRNAERFHTLGL